MGGLSLGAVTHKLARPRGMVAAEKGARGRSRAPGGRMTIISCPWCETELRLESPRLESSEVGCLECSSSWLVGDLAEDLALAA